MVADQLAAAKQLDWSHIDCIEVDDDDVQAELWEIAENLHRCDLTKEQRDKHIRRYAELLTRRREALIDTPLAQQLPRPIGRPKSITQEIVENTGLSRDTVRRAIKNEHRRYAELLEKQREVSRQTDAKPTSGPKGGRPQGVASQIADETGHDDLTTRSWSGINPRPILRHSLHSRAARYPPRHLH